MSDVEQKGVASIAASFKRLCGKIEDAAKKFGRDPREIKLVAASKGVDRQGICEAFDAGISLFGENKVAEAIEKFSDLRKGVSQYAPKEESSRSVSLHLIGSLQTNKVRKAVGFFDLIHSIDSIHLAEAVSQEAARRLIVQPVLVQVNVAQDIKKRGVSIHEAPFLVEKVRKLASLRLLGLMTIPPVSTCPEDSRPHYARLKALGNALDLHQFSMGMSNDFEVAIAEGATWVRIGTALFGPRRQDAVVN